MKLKEKCPKCKRRLLTLYYRNNNEKRSWKATEYLYCKNCKEVFEK